MRCVGFAFLAMLASVPGTNATRDDDDDEVAVRVTAKTGNECTITPPGKSALKAQVKTCDECELDHDFLKAAVTASPSGNMCKCQLSGYPDTMLKAKKEKCTKQACADTFELWNPELVGGVVETKTCATPLGTSPTQAAEQADDDYNNDNTGGWCTVGFPSAPDFDTWGITKEVFQGLKWEANVMRKHVDKCEDQCLKLSHDELMKLLAVEPPAELLEEAILAKRIGNKKKREFTCTFDDGYSIFADDVRVIGEPSAVGCYHKIMEHLQLDPSPSSFWDNVSPSCDLDMDQ